MQPKILVLLLAEAARSASRHNPGPLDPVESQHCDGATQQLQKTDLFADRKISDGNARRRDHVHVDHNLVGAETLHPQIPDQ